MIREFYDYPIRWQNKDGFLLWFQGDHERDELDGVVCDEDNLIPIFSSVSSLEIYARQNNLEPLNRSEFAMVNFDSLDAWLRSRRNSFNSCHFLEVWNLLDDVSRSINGDFDSDRDRTYEIYDKIFRGNNLPAVTPKNRHYRPIWSPLEIAIIRLTLKRGLKMFGDAAYFHAV